MSTAEQPGPSLAEQLGYAPDAKLLIVNCDDLGSSRAANVAVYDAVRRGVATSATLMVPCPWSRDAAAMYRGEDIGVHLTLTSEWETYRWGPITHSPSLLDGDGGFPRTIQDAWDHGDIDEVRKECRTQIERATGAEPFKLPDNWIAARAALDPRQPFDFVTTNDTVGGNSGSPVINKAGEVVGLGFDSNMQSLGGDYGYNAAVNRTIAVNVGAIREALSKVYRADRLVRELAN